MQKISANNFLCVFLSCHYGFNNYFETLIFAFSNIIPRGGLNLYNITFLELVIPEITLYKSCKFTLNPLFWGFQSDFANFEE